MRQTLETMRPTIPWRGLRIIGRHQPGMALSVRGYYRHHEESYVVAAAISDLLAMGYGTEHLFPEMLIAPACRPDLVAVSPEQSFVLIFEAKREPPASTQRRQLRRYLDAATERWPGWAVRGFLIWPREPRTYVTDGAALAIEEMAA